MQPTPLPASGTPPRFRWPLQLFIGFLIFNMAYHSVASMTDYIDWMKQKEMRRFPRRLPTWQEIRDPSEEDPPGERAMESLDSIWDYFRPWPGRTTREKLEGPREYCMFAMAWTASRLDLFEDLIGVPQRWTMFSPNAYKGCSVARFRLRFSDDTVQELRITGDPADLTRYSHWFDEKILDAELKVVSDADSRLGYCSHLAHRYAHNRAGAPLVSIYIYEVEYRYPDPDEDIAEVLASQNGPPGWDEHGPRWIYEPARTPEHPDGLREHPHGKVETVSREQAQRIRETLRQLHSVPGAP